MSKHSQNKKHAEDIVGENPEAEQAGLEINPEILEKREVPGESEAPIAEESTDPEQIIADLQAKLAESHDQFLRKAADFENFRKRMNREKLELTEFANQNLILDLLPIIDDFERAIKSAEVCSSLKTCNEFAGFYEGIIMIEKRLSSQLESKWKLKRFESAGQVFDPSLHEAIQMDKSPEVTEAVVVEDYLKGYLLNEKVIRFAKVKVLMPEEVKE
ncbi:MAG: nucleotide exchange factor GrpE [Treponema sp.]|nr:nucleotide exchange factor GrpE [Treponema sp.]